MPVGNQATEASINQAITAYATQLRDLMQNIANLSMGVNGQGAGLAYLQGVGYGGSSDPLNPGSISDAQYALNMISYLNTVAGLYFGTATQSAEFSFHQELSQVWAGS